MITEPPDDEKGGARPSRRLDVLRAVTEASAPIGISEIARRLALHPNTVRFHLDTLIENGQVERVRSDRNTPGRPPLLFQGARGMDRTGPRRYALLASVLATTLADSPDGAARALQAGRTWGRRMAAGSEVATDAEQPIGRLVSLLDDLGFAPERAGDESSVGLRHCPFLELAETSTDVVCPVHLGLMQGAMEAWEAPATVDRLQPFAEPDLCVAHLARKPA